MQRGNIEVGCAKLSWIAPDDKGVHAARAEVFGRRAAEEASTMSKGIFSWAEHESQEKSH